MLQGALQFTACSTGRAPMLHDRPNGGKTAKILMSKKTLILLSICILASEMFGASFRGLGDLSGGKFYSIASAVTSDGLVVVGTSHSDRGYEAFRWSAAGVMQGLGALTGGSFYSAASGVSADGAVVVGTSSSSAGRQAFRWTEVVGMEGLGDLPGGSFESWATAVSADGTVVVGHSSSELAPTYREAFRWTAREGMIALGELPGGKESSQAFAVSADGLIIVGASGSANSSYGVWEGFRWTAATGMQPLGDFLGGYYNSVAYGISPEGSIIVGRGHTGVEDPFLWTAEAGLLHLGFLPCDTWSTAFAASSNGNTVVGDPNQGTGDCAFLWDAQHGMRNLRAVLVGDYGLDLTGWKLSAARAITPDGGTIVGYGVNPAGATEAWIATGLVRPVTLSVSSDVNHVLLSWPTNAIGFCLQVSSGLLDTDWADVGIPAAVVGTQFQIRYPNTDTAMFFRLKK